MEPEGTCYSQITSAEGLNDRSLVLFYKAAEIKDNLTVKQL